MADAPRITAEQLRRRIEAGEDFTFIDTRNPTAWAESDSMIPMALRIPADTPTQQLSGIPQHKPIVTYCT